MTDANADRAAAPRPAPVVRGADLLLGGLALAWFLLEWLPGVTGPYGWFIDELYYAACARHLAWGYVDHPPLSIALLALVRAVGGDSLVLMRLVSAAAGAATVFATGRLARRLGAGTFGQALAAGALMAGAIAMVMCGFYSMNAFDLLIWTLCFHVLVDVAEHDRPRDWIRFGALFGIGLMNKHTIVLLAVGLVAGMLLTRARRQLVRPWFWAAMGVALLILLPNLAWQARNGWPSIEFYINADLYKNNPTPPLEVLLQQVLFMNPGALPVWIAGLVFLLGRGRDGGLRHLAWIWIVMLLMMMLGQKSRPDRLTPAYPLLLAAGGAAIDAFIRRRGTRWLRPALAAGLIAFGAALLPLGVPVLPPATTAAYGGALGIVPQIESGEGKRSDLPQWLADRFGWRALAGDVAHAAAMLDDGERATTVVLAPSYGQAGAIELYGRDLPPVYATHNNYFLWGPPPDDVTTVIVIGFGDALLRRWFERVDPVMVHHCRWCMRWRDGMPIRIARGPRVPFRDVWTDFKAFE